jgi:mannose-6-phosphate isomerase-like protein (cupin superfamily)
MFVRSLADCEEFVAGDDSLLCELLHPDKAEIDIRYSLAHARLPAGEVTKRHRLATSEVYYVIEGTGKMTIDDESREVSPGCALYIPPGAIQSIENTGTGDLIFLCIVDPAWRPEDEEILVD